MKLLISGALGRMGRQVYEYALKRQNVQTVAGVDINAKLSNLPYPVYENYSQVKEKPDCIIDFSSPAALPNLLDYANKNGVPVVLCATGYGETELNLIKEHSKNNAVFKSANMSLGVNVLLNLIKKATAALEGFDIEIIEKHHNQKADAPSGTALMFADGIKQEKPEKFYVYGREGKPGKRNPDEIGIHAIRGGNIVGEHEIIFAGNNEIISFKHEALSRSVFAEGALNAALYVANKKCGIYDMQDMLNGK